MKVCFFERLESTKAKASYVHFGVTTNWRLVPSILYFSSSNLAQLKN
jgi:hypothetical protein